MHRFNAALAACLAAALSPALSAATPAEGVITPSQPSVEFSGGPYLIPNVTNLVQEADEDTLCEEGTPTCDIFRFEVKDMSDDQTTNGQLVITVTWEDTVPGPPANPEGLVPELPDYDLELFDDTTGAKLTQQATADNPEILVTVPANRKYQLRIIPYAAMNVPYTGKVEYRRDPEARSTGALGGVFGASALLALALAGLARTRRGN